MAISGQGLVKIARLPSLCGQPSDIARTAVATAFYLTYRVKMPCCASYCCCLLLAKCFANYPPRFRVCFHLNEDRSLSVLYHKITLSWTEPALPAYISFAKFFLQKFHQLPLKCFLLRIDIDRLLVPI